MTRLALLALAALAMVVATLHYVRRREPEYVCWWDEPDDGLECDWPGYEDLRRVALGWDGCP
jgi:hypothetical protein